MYILVHTTQLSTLHLPYCIVQALICIQIDTHICTYIKYDCIHICTYRLLIHRLSGDFFC